MKIKKKTIALVILSGAYVLLRAFTHEECRRCPVHTKPWMKWIMNPCNNCRVLGGTKEPPSI